MIEVLKENKVTGKPAFVPSAENLKALNDASLEMSMQASEEVQRLKKALDDAILVIAELMEKEEKEEKGEKNE